MKLSALYCRVPEKVNSSSASTKVTSILQMLRILSPHAIRKRRTKLDNLHDAAADPVYVLSSVRCGVQLDLCG